MNNKAQNIIQLAKDHANAFGSAYISLNDDVIYTVKHNWNSGRYVFSKDGKKWSQQAVLEMLNHFVGADSVYGYRISVNNRQQHQADRLDAFCK